MSTTAHAAQTSAPPAQTTPNRQAASQRRADTSGTDAPEPFAHLLGLLADTRVEAAQAAPPSEPEPEPVSAVLLELAQDTGRMDGSRAGLGADGSDADADLRTFGRIHPGLDNRAGLSTGAGQAPEAATADIVAAADRSGLPNEANGSTPAESGTAQPALPAQGLAARLRPGTAMARPTDRPTTLMLQGRDTVNWGGAGSARMPADVAPGPLPAGSTSRSTVTLDQRFSLARGTERGAASQPESQAGMALAASASAPASAGGQSSSGHGGAGGGDSLGQTAGADTATADEPAEGADLPFDLETAEAPQEQELRGWTAASLRQASVRVGQGSEQAIDIDISLQGKEVSIDFRTDNAEARGTLQSQAGQALSQMLERSGMQLGGLSVGGQATGDRSGSGEPAATVRRADASSSAKPAEAQPQGLARAAGGGGRSSLDLFV